MVTSRATSDSHALAEAPTSNTAPVVSDTRNVMMATTAIRAWPAMELRGTSGVSKRGSTPPGLRGASISAVTSSTIIDSTVQS